MLWALDGRVVRIRVRLNELEEVNGEARSAPRRPTPPRPAPPRPALRCVARTWRLPGAGVVMTPASLADQVWANMWPTETLVRFDPTRLVPKPFLIRPNNGSLLRGGSEEWPELLRRRARRRFARASLWRPSPPFSQSGAAAGCSGGLTSAGFGRRRKPRGAPGVSTCSTASRTGDESLHERVKLDSFRDPPLPPSR